MKVTRTIEIKTELSEPVITPYFNGYLFETTVIIVSPKRRHNRPVRRFVIKPAKLWLKSPVIDSDDK